MTARDAEAQLLVLSDEKTAEVSRRFFKTGPGQYSEGDHFIGIKTTPLRQLARTFQVMPLKEVCKLLNSSCHEARMLALLILVRAFEKGDESTRKAIFELYLANTDCINNWGLVDASARTIVGGYLADRDRAPLYRLAESPSVWERRIAVVATHAFIRDGDFADTLRLAVLLLTDREDLIQKAVGWMLKEISKRDRAKLETFLAEHYRIMPRTMLRYAIEKLPEPRRRQYLKGEV